MSPSILWQQTVDPRGLAGTSEVAEFSPDNRYIAAGAEDGRLRFYTSAGQKLWESQFNTYSSGTAGEIESLAFSPDGRYVAAGGNVGGVKIYQTSNGQVIKSLSASEVDGMAWSPNGQQLALSNGTSVNVYNTSDWSRRYSFSTGGSTNSIEFTKDSQYLVSAGSSRRVYVHRAADGVQIRSFVAAGSEGSIKSVRLSPDGSMIATGNGNEGSFSVFRLDGTPITRVDLSVNIVEAVAWSPDSKWLVVGGGGGDSTRSTNALRVFRTSDWRLVQTVQAHDQLIEYIDFAADGTFITSSEDGSVIRWTSPSGDGATPLPTPTPTPAPAPIPTPTPTPVTPTPSNGTGNGLAGEYFNNMDLTNSAVRRTDSTVNFNWGQGSPDARVGADTFSVRWKGQIQPRFSEEYTFYTSTDDGVRLWINGQPVVNNWRDQSLTTSSGKIRLEAGQRYDIQLEYYDKGGNAIAKLEWSSTSQSREVVPSSRLYSGTASTQALNLGTTPTPTPTPTVATPQTVTVEAETIAQLSGFRREAVAAASGGSAISFNNGAIAEQGTTTFDFTGVQGNYNIVVGYFDEMDGVASASLSVENQPISSWQLSQSLGSNSASAQTLTSRTIANVSLTPGDTIQLSGTENNNEHLRIDKLTFVPV